MIPTLSCITCHHSFTKDGFNTHLTHIDESIICERCHTQLPEDSIIYDHQPSTHFGNPVTETIMVGYTCPICQQTILI